MIDLHWNTVSPALRAVLNDFSKSPLASEFYLAGGTAFRWIWIFSPRPKAIFPH